VIIVLLVVAFHKSPDSWWANGQSFLSSKTSAYQSPTPMKMGRLPADLALPIVAQCESDGEQFDKKGNVKTNVNPNGTIDRGKWQINSGHDEELEGLPHINIETEAGNEAFARILYERNELDDWQASRHCWESKLLELGWKPSLQMVNTIQTFILHPDQPVSGVIEPGWQLDWWGDTTKLDTNVVWRGRNKVQTFVAKAGVDKVELKFRIYPCSTEAPCKI